MDKIPVLVHIGMHKTGTSFLQKEIFPQVKNALYSKNKLLRDYYHRDRGNSIIVSDEILSGNPFVKDTMDDFIWKSRMLKSMFSEAIILVCFREPIEYIKSLYKQFLHQGGTITFNEFFNLENTGILKIEDLSYLTRIAILKKNFKEVIAYDFSLFKRDPQFVFDIVEKKMQLKINVPSRKKGVNVGVSKVWQIKLLRRLNGIFGFTYHNSRFRRRKLTPRNLVQGKLAFIKGEEWDLDEKLKKEIHDYFKSDWESTKGIILH